MDHFEDDDKRLFKFLVLVLRLLDYMLIFIFTIGLIILCVVLPILTVVIYFRD